MIKQVMNTIIEAILHTPWWAFVIFVVLIFLGYKQSFDHTLDFKRAVIFPIAMLIFSLFSLLSSFGFLFYSSLNWLAGLIFGVILGLNNFKSQIIKISSDLFLIKGNRCYIVIMMTIFFTKYIVAYSEARNLEILKSNLFISFISFILGIFSGIFAARILAILRLR